MSNVEFGDQTGLGQNSRAFRRIEADTSKKGMIGWLVKNNYAKSDNAAQIILVAIAVFFFLMSALMFVIL